MSTKNTEMTRESQKNTDKRTSRGNVGRTRKSNYSTRLLNKSEDFEYHVVEKTPFTVTRVLNEWNVMIGTQLVSRGYKSLEEAVEKGCLFNWDIVMHVMAIFIEKYKPKE